MKKKGQEKYLASTSKKNQENQLKEGKKPKWTGGRGGGEWGTRLRGGDRSELNLSLGVKRRSSFDKMVGRGSQQKQGGGGREEIGFFHTCTRKGEVRPKKSVRERRAGGYERPNGRGKGGKSGESGSEGWGAAQTHLKKGNGSRKNGPKQNSRDFGKL